MLKVGDKVRLISLPVPNNKYLSPDYTDCLTVGNIYIILDFEGSNVWTTSDDPQGSVTFNRDRVVKVD